MGFVMVALIALAAFVAIGAVLDKITWEHAITLLIVLLIIAVAAQYLPQR